MSVTVDVSKLEHLDERRKRLELLRAGYDLFDAETERLNKEADLARKPVTELSVGQQQRVAAARALMGGPELVIADEPTSSLDAALREVFIELLFRECARDDVTLVFVSHDESLSPLFDRTVRLPGVNRAGREGRR